MYVALVVDAFARRIVGGGGGAWRVPKSLRTDLVLDALEQAICERQDGSPAKLVHHSDPLNPASTSRFATPSGWLTRASSRP